MSQYIFAAEFSPSSEVVYLVSHGNLYQYNLNAVNPKATETIIYSNPYNNTNLPADSQLQLGMSKLGLDGLIYLALCPSGNIDNQPATYQFNPRSKYLAVVHNPDVLGTGCNFQLDGFYLGGKYSTYAMPNTAYHLGPLIGSGCDTLIPPTVMFDAPQSSVCTNGCVSFGNQTETVGNTVSYQWLFPGGNPTASSDSTPVVCYPNAGSYDVTLIATNPFGSDTVAMSNYVTVTAAPNANITPSGNDLQATQGFASYQWSLNGNALVGTSNIIPLQGSGTYSVTVTDNNDCTAQSSYVVTGINALVETSFVIQPNPASGKVVCSWSNIQVQAIELYDVLGRNVLQQKINNSHQATSTSSVQAVLDLSGLSSGVYLIRALMKDGDTLVKKVVVE